MTKDKKRLIQWSLILLIVLTLSFIWGNSLLDRESSTEISSGLLDFLKPLLELIGMESGSDRWLRKLAHFCEFALLGAELCGLAILHERENIRSLLSCSALSLAAAFTDETIQHFSGRHPSLWDVVLDFSGSICGIAFMLLALKLWYAWKKSVL